jgi:hypothetical protein
MWRGQVRYEDDRTNFGEYLHLALSRKREALPFFTFDRKAAKATGAHRLLIG